MVINIELPDRWKRVNLGDVLSYIGNGLTNKQNKANDGYPVTRIETISDDCINAGKVGYVDILTSDKIEKYRLYYGDILVSHINSEPQLGRAVIYEGKPEFLLHGMNLLRMRADTKTLDPFFLTFIFKFYRNRGVFIALASRAVGQASINQSRMKSLMIPLPPIPEQRAIAHVLQTIQEAKFTRQREIALEREHKAALMDYLFSHGTKGEPRKQIEIGEIPRSWEVVQLKEIANLRRENVQPKDSQGLNFVGLEHIDSGESILQRWGDASEMKSAKTHFYPNDVLYGKLRSYLDKAVIAEMEGICSTDILVFTVNSKAAPRFLVYLLHTETFVNHAIATSTGISHPRTSWDSLGKFTFALPPLSEQHAIAAVFQAIDEKIAALEREVERLDELFHAMLEGLMTGQTSAVPLIESGEIQ